MSRSEREYYRMRARIERLRAEQAEHPRARAAHEEMACFYAKIVDLEEQPVELTLVEPVRLSA